MGRKYGVRISVRMFLLIFEVFLSLLEHRIHVIWIVFTYNQILHPLTSSLLLARASSLTTNNSIISVHRHLV